MRVSAALLLSALVLVAGPVAAIELGRLFTSPAEREALDRLRRQERPQEGRVEQAGAESGEPRAATLELNGVVKRSGGGEVVWINGQRLEGRRGPAGVRLYRGADRHHRVVVGLPGKKVVTIKPGQQVDLESGKVVERYEAGEAHGSRP